jgi:hypothetical protein
MSRKLLIIAASHMAFALGERENMWKLYEKSNITPPQQITALSEYVQLAFDMVEVGEGIAMQKPQKVERNVYYEFGDDFARFIRGNERLPNEDEGKEMLRHVVINAFGDMLNRDQMINLHKKLKEM